MNKRTFFLCMSFFGLFYTNLGLATDQPDSAFHSLDELYDQALAFLKQKTDQTLIDPQIELKKLNPRIQLPQCESPIEIIDRTPSRLGGRTTLGLKCSQPSWQTYISAHIDGKLPVVVTTQGILKSTIIKPEDVSIANVHYKKVPNDAVVSLDTAYGMRAKKSIPADTVLNLRALQPPYWVLKNHPVDILTKIGQIEIRAKGLALEAGVENQQVDIENRSSEKIIKGTVIAPNTVYVP